MTRNALFSILLLAGVWIILRENLTLAEAAVGILLGACCVFFSSWLLPFPKIEVINPFRMALYPFYLIGQIYAAGFSAVKYVFTDSDAEIVRVKTRLPNNFTRILLANSITLIPGSIS
ncbi:MAG: Na+/H+ antiporter subunit E, partial [Treponema sp.]|nr:Na+/H+ antiporter subunit E [Treponema sp.]